MKKYLVFILLLISSLAAYAQTDGISYQAVIIDPNPKEIPGVDLQGNILPNAEVTIRFTILDQNNTEEYQEVQTTRTDAYGMINVMIGQGDPTGVGVGEFTLIDWDGLPRSLQVDIDFNGTGSSFVDLNRQELTFVPYAFHRNITASGDMTVDGTTDLNGVLTVQGPVDLNNSLDVTNGNPTVLSGSLRVDSATYLGDQLTVLGMTNLNDSVYINNQRPSYFTGNITVDGTSTFNGAAKFNSPVDFNEITVNGPSNLNGQVTVRANMDDVPGGQSNYNGYPLLVEGSKQGMAIKVNEDRSVDNNYISFWDSSGEMWGRIEGIQFDELDQDVDYVNERQIRVIDVTINSVETGIYLAELFQANIDYAAALSSSTPCAGLGACVTAPIPSLITSGFLDVILKIANNLVVGANLGLSIAELVEFDRIARENIGVTYQSGAGDYAEWLPKENPGETFQVGDIVGVRHGMVTKNTWGVEKIMIVSTRPIVLGNMPQSEDESAHVKIAFMGQVPAKIIGKVEPGDYILPSEMGNGFGKAINPNNMQTRDYQKIAGVAWNIMEEIGNNVSIVNVAVGINTNDVSSKLYDLELQVATLRENYSQLNNQIEQTNARLAKLIPGFSDGDMMNSTGGVMELSQTKNSSHDHSNTNLTMNHPEENDIIFFEMPRESIEEALELARDRYKEMLASSELLVSKPKTDNRLLGMSEEQMTMIPIAEHPFWQRIDLDPTYKKEIIDYVQSELEKAIHTHKKFAHHFSEMTIK